MVLPWTVYFALLLRAVKSAAARGMSRVVMGRGQFTSSSYSATAPPSLSASSSASLSEGVMNVRALMGTLPVTTPHIS